MTNSKPKKDPEPTIRDLYTELKKEQLTNADKNLDRYVALVAQLYERIRQDPDDYAQFTHLTAATDDVELHVKVNHNTTNAIFKINDSKTTWEEIFSAIGKGD